MVDSPPAVQPALRGAAQPRPDWLTGCRGLFSEDRPLPRLFFPARSGMADFDSVRMILAKCNLQSEWMKHVRPDGSLFYLQPVPEPDPDLNPDKKPGPEQKTDRVRRRRDSGIEDDLMLERRKSSKIIKSLLRTFLLKKRNGVQEPYRNGDKTTNVVNNDPELQRFHVRLKVDPRSSGISQDGVFPIEKLTKLELAKNGTSNHCNRNQIFVEDLPEYGALTRLSNLRRGDCISALNDISVNRGNLSRLLAAISQPMEVVLTIERPQRPSPRMRIIMHQLDVVPESRKDETHAQQNGSLISTEWSRAITNCPTPELGC